MMKFQFRSLVRPTALVASLAVTALSLLPRIGTAGSDGTIGSLPSGDSGDGSQTFYLTGPRSLMDDVILTAGGTGYYVPVDLPGGDVWLEFYGDVCVTLDQQVLADHPELELGLTSGFVGGGMLVEPEVGGLLSGRQLFVASGLTLPTPYGRIAEMLPQGLRLLTTQRIHRAHAVVSYDLFGGLLNVCQDHQ